MRRAASGSCAKAIRYCLSCVGTKPVGTLAKPPIASATSPASTASAAPLRCVSRVTVRPYPADERSKKRLKARKPRPNTRSMARVGRSGGAPCGLSRMAASAGDSVSELKAEMSVEKAIVSANWRKNCPVSPLMKAIGTKTAHSSSAIATIGPLTSPMAL